MLNKDKLIDAFNEIDPEYINSARDRMGYGSREKPKKTLQKSPRRARLIRLARPARRKSAARPFPRP